MNKRVIFIFLSVAILSLSNIYALTFNSQAAEQACALKYGAQWESITPALRQACTDENQNIKIVASKKETKEYPLYLRKDRAYFEKILYNSDKLFNSQIKIWCQNSLHPRCFRKPKQDQVAYLAEKILFNLNNPLVSSAMVTCSYIIPQGQTFAPDGTLSDSCETGQAWDMVGGSLCNYPVQFDIMIRKNKPEEAVPTNCREVQIPGMPDPLTTCGFKVEGCEASPPGSSVESASGSPPPAAILGELGESKLPLLDWTKLFFFALFAGIISMLIIADRNNKRGRQASRRPSSYKFHHFLNSNKYAKSFRR